MCSSDLVLLRDPTLTAGEILMSESQERMMAVVAPEKLEEFLAITGKWDVETAVIGEVTGTQRLTIDHHGHRIVDVDPRTVAHDSPVYDRPYAKPAWQDELNDDGAARLGRASSPQELREQVLAVLASANLAAKSWVTDQYDRYVQGNTAMAQPDDAGVVRVDESTGLGVALSTDANGRFAKLDPYTGAQLALAEAYRNVATVGAEPLAVTDCLNFGSPEDPDAMWQLVQAITGLADACAELGVPVTGGNVSLYNSTLAGEVGKGHIDASINPTPVVGVLGVLDDVARATPSAWNTEGLEVYLLGSTEEDLSGSVWADVVHSHLGGHPPKADLAAERSLAQVLIAAGGSGLAAAAHDLSDGGLIQSLTEAVLRHGVGVEMDLADLLQRDGVDLTTALLAETGARALVALAPERAEELTRLAGQHGVPVVRIGATGGSGIDIAGEFSIDGAALRQAHEGTLPELFA